MRVTRDILKRLAGPYIEALTAGAARLHAAGKLEQAGYLGQIAGWYREEVEPEVPDPEEGTTADDLPNPTYDVDWMSGNCPVQAEGSCCGGRRFYFRARGEELQITITRMPLSEGDFLNWPVPEEGRWYYAQDYALWPAAGWIDHPTAHAFIAWAVRKFHGDVLLAPYTKRAGEEAERWIESGDFMQGCAGDREEGTDA